MIMEKFGGPKALAAALHTNLETGIENTATDKLDR
jgi:hypothetical protein